VGWIVQGPNILTCSLGITVHYCSFIELRPLSKVIAAAAGTPQTLLSPFNSLGCLHDHFTVCTVSTYTGACLCKVVILDCLAFLYDLCTDFSTFWCKLLNVIHNCMVYIEREVKKTYKSPGHIYYTRYTLKWSISTSTTIISILICSFNYYPY
jgi:hypothetical protein